VAQAADPFQVALGGPRGNGGERAEVAPLQLARGPRSDAHDAYNLSMDTPLKVVF
jgi:hypothetical protein